MKIVTRNLKYQHVDTPEPWNECLAGSTGARRILFVDDESDWRETGTLYLTECGYQVVPAKDGAEALEQAARVRPDVIVLDLNLGDESGLTVLKLLSVTHPQTPVLIYTGMDLDEAAILELKEEGAFDCLQKGTMEELLDAVGAAINAPPPEFVEEIPEEPCRPIEPPVNSGVESVLIVEDEVEFGDTLRTFLESHPYSVTRVTDGAEGLRQLTAVDFDIILCDMVLPSLSGEELYKAVETTRPHLCKRFIFMTGHQADPQSDHFIRSIGALMLWKPFHLADLLTAVRTVGKANSSAR